MSENPQEQVEAKLLSYVDGELDDADRGDIERHLEANPKHRQLLADLAAGRALVRGLAREPAPADLFDGFQAQLERQVLLELPGGSPNNTSGGGDGRGGADDVNDPATLRIQRWVRVRRAAAAAVVIGGIGIVLYSATPQRPGGVAMRSGPVAAPEAGALPAVPAPLPSTPFPGAAEPTAPQGPSPLSSPLVDRPAPPADGAEDAAPAQPTPGGLAAPSGGAAAMGDARGRRVARAEKAGPSDPAAVQVGPPAQPGPVSLVAKAMEDQERRERMLRSADRARSAPAVLAALGRAPATPLVAGARPGAGRATAAGLAASDASKDAVPAGRAPVALPPVALPTAADPRDVAAGDAAATPSREPLVLVVASADPSAIQQQLALMLGDQAQSVSRVRGLDVARDGLRPDGQSPPAAPRPEAAPGAGAAAIGAQGDRFRAAGHADDAPGGPAPRRGPAEAPAAAAATPAAAPAPVAAAAPAAPAAAAAAKPAGQPTAAATPLPTPVAPAPDGAIAAAPAARQAEASRGGGAMAGRPDEVLVVRRVSRARAASLVAALNRPDLAQYAVAYGAPDAAPPPRPARAFPSAGPVAGGLPAAPATNQPSTGPANPTATPAAPAPRPARPSTTVPSLTSAAAVPATPAMPAAAPPASAPLAPAPPALVPPALVPPAAAATRPAAGDAIGRGDVLQLVYRNLRRARPLATPVQVSDRGTIVAVGLGEVEVAGLTPAQATDRLTDAMRRRVPGSEGAELRRPTPEELAAAAPPRPAVAAAAPRAKATAAVPDRRPAGGGGSGQGAPAGTSLAGTTVAPSPRPSAEDVTAAQEAAPLSDDAVDVVIVVQQTPDAAAPVAPPGPDAAPGTHAMRPATNPAAPLPR
jgi:collagen type IV alpha